VALHEWSGWGAAAAKGKAAGQMVTFEALAQHWLRRSTKTSPSALSGNVWHEPLPLDFARETEPLLALLSAALKAAGVPTHPGDGGVALRVLEAPNAVLAVAVNETPAAAIRNLRVANRRLAIPVAALRSRLVLFERATGKVIVATPGDAIH
jgi:hypothetical protein